MMSPYLTFCPSFTIGNSTEPHIHFQVMNDKNIEACTSLKIRFLNNRELIKGDVV
jgi:murein DD-endopeptidase MepM/ murein hydrolase activator NlpD